MIFMKVERNFLPWIATNKTLGNGFSFEFLKKVENKYKLEKNMYKYFFELDSDFYNSAISRNPFYVISILLRLSS